MNIEVRKKAIIDLHVHSNHSDGTCSPKSMIDAFAGDRKKSKLLAFTDHYSMVACTDELIEYAARRNVRLLRGTEIGVNYSKFNLKGLHILGYGMKGLSITADRPDMKEVVGRITDAGGVAVIAHPLAIRFRETFHRLNDEQFEELLFKFKLAGGYGTEAYPANEFVEPAALHKTQTIAKSLQLGFTGGSDFHGYKGQKLGNLYMTAGDTNALLSAVKDRN